MGAGNAAAASWLECETMAEVLNGAITLEQCCGRVDLMQRVMAALPLIMMLPLVVAWSHLPAYSVIDPQVFERVEPLGGGRRMIQ